MAKNKKPRKKYTAKWSPTLDNVSHVINRIKPIDPDKVLMERLAIAQVMINMTHGKGDRGQWESIKDLLNTAEKIAEGDFGKPHIQEILDAQAAHQECGRRGDAGSFGYSQPELQAVNRAIQVYAEQIQYANLGRVHAAIREVDRHMSSNKTVISVLPINQPKENHDSYELHRN